MKQADLIAEIRKNERKYFDRLDTQFVFRDGRKRKMIGLRVRATGLHRARVIAKQLKRQLAARINRCQRVEHLIVQIGTGLNNPFFMWEQIEIDSILGVDSPLKKRWREAVTYEAARLKQGLEIAVVLWITPRHRVNNQLPNRA